jgi:hypothetical protein
VPIADAHGPRSSEAIAEIGLNLTRIAKPSPAGTVTSALSRAAGVDNGDPIVVGRVQRVSPPRQFRPLANRTARDRLEDFLLHRLADGGVELDSESRAGFEVARSQTSPSLPQKGENRGPLSGYSCKSGIFGENIGWRCPKARLAVPSQGFTC